MPRILAVGTAVPPQRYSQREVYEFAARHVERYRNPRIEHMFMTSDVDYRHFSFDFATLDPQESADEMHRRFRVNSILLAAQAVRECLPKSGLLPTDIDYVVAVTCTGYLCPGLSALLIREMGMRHDVQRADLVGMGCAGAMPGLQRAYDYVRAYPGKKALLVTVEVCSACYYIDDTVETIVGNAICGDGAAAVVVSDSPAGTGPQLRRFETLVEPSLLESVGFQFRSGKLRIVLSKDIRDTAGTLARKVIMQMLDREGLAIDDVQHWIVHSGGRKVIDNIKTAVGLSERQLEHSRCVLKNFGNMSSPTVLYVLKETVERSRPKGGELGVMLAMGPGLAVEGALVEW